MKRNFKTSPYRRGWHFEDRVRKHYQNMGWLVVRNAKSAFPDLLCVKEGEIHVVECKVSGYANPKERAQLILDAKKAGGKPLIAYRFGKKIRFKTLPLEKHLKKNSD